MASNSFMKRLREEATCFICWGYYDNPIILDCGHNFCLACVSECWKEFPNNTVCPECRSAIERLNCCSNTLLANVVEITKQLHSQVKEDEGRKICEKHPESSQAAFCKEDQIIFCLACEGSEQHRNHRVASVEEAAQLYKDCFSFYIEALKKERAEMVKLKVSVAEWADHVLKKTVAENHGITARFRQLHEFLIYQETALLMNVQSVPKWITQKRDKDLGLLCVEIFTLENIIRLLEEKASQPKDEFLQDAWRTFDRCRGRAQFPNLEDISLDLKWGLWELIESNAVMRSLAKYFTDTLVNACTLKKASVTLDINTHHPQLILSPDRRSVKWTHVVVQLPNSRKRFEKHFCVVGRQKFTNGRHCWEVLVTGQGEWAVGVAKSSVKRKGFFNLCVEEGIYAVGKLEQQYRVINVPHTPRLPLDRELRRIRVSLNCSARQVNFYDVSRATKIFGFTEIASFHGSFLPFFWLNGQIRLSLK